MTPEQYAVQQALITAATTRFVLGFSRFFTRPFLTVKDWLNLLGLLYPEIERQRERSAEVARRFYDSERLKHVPDLPVNARLLEPYRFDWFVKSMDPVREQMTREDATDASLAAFTFRAVREVENAGRRQIIHAVQEDKQLEEKIVAEKAAPREKLKFDPGVKQELLDILNGGKDVERPTWGGQTVTEKAKPPKEQSSVLVKGWARVATGKETCAWCLMLVSRGPVYEKAATAGLDLPDDVAVDMIAAGEDVSSFMDDWHTGCDCQIVPVFDLMEWPGRKESQRAYSLWKDATEKAKAALNEDPDKEYYSINGPIGKGKAAKRQPPGWYKTTLNREALNQLRKMIDAGEVDSQEWAALAA